MDSTLLKNRVTSEVQSAQNLEALEEVFRRYLGKNGEFTQILRSLRGLDQEERIRVGRETNDLKNFFIGQVELKRREYQGGESQGQAKGERIDVTAPGKRIVSGHLHPLTLVQRKAVEIFSSMGFAVAEGPEVETEWYNFDALHIPPNHPARDMWDTFWLEEKQKEFEVSSPQFPKTKTPKLLLRTHTSPVQIRYMESRNPPLRVIAPGRIFRYEATDASHEINFYQLEGLMVGKDTSAAHFKGVIQEFFRRFFGKLVAVRLRPSYFPFTEPSFEVDMSCLICGGKGCASCAKAGWIEIMGAGMVHPSVFKAVRYVPRDWRGFAFGMGLDRLTMMKYKIGDIRLLYSGDLRFLQQF